MGISTTYTSEQLAKEKKHIQREYKKLLSALSAKLQSEEDKKLIHKAFKVAADAHSVMRRSSGEPYILHPIEVAKICVKEIGLGIRSTIAALLHDVVEDTAITIDDIEAKFGKEIAKIVEGLTKIDIISTSQSVISKQAENFKRIVLSIVDDPRIIFIKLADRLHNMRTLTQIPRNKQVKISSETMYIYAPLAHRLGFNKIKTEMEDIAFKYANPHEYEQIEAEIQETKMQRTRFIAHFVKPIKNQLNEDSTINYHIAGRTKSTYSIWNKMKKQQISFKEVFDQFAIRIIIKGCNTEKEEIDKCWKTYSIVANLYQPIPSRLRDWLSNPKANGYKALHMTVMTTKGRAVEVQIRTEKMNEIAENGMAAHWKYKESTEQENNFDVWIKRIKQTFVSSFDHDSVEFLIDFKNNFLADEIYVFTHKGDTKILPAEASVLDFAYAVHSDIGNQCFAAKVNGKVTPINHKLASGDKIEIITSSKQHPKADWMHFVVTSKAKAQIREALKVETRQLASEGKVIFERKCKSWKVTPNDKLFHSLLKKSKQESLLNFYANIKKQPHYIDEIKVWVEEYKKPSQKTTTPIPKNALSDSVVSKEAVEIFGEINEPIQYTFASCCNPILGDEIFGFISRNPQDGVRIHKMQCKNAKYLFANYANRIITANWASSQIERLFETTITLKGVDSMGLINELTQKISSKFHLNIIAINFETDAGAFEGKIRLFVKDRDQLDHLLHYFEEHPSINTIKQDNDEVLITK